MPYLCLSVVSIQCTQRTQCNEHIGRNATRGTTVGNNDYFYCCFSTVASSASAALVAYFLHSLRCVFAAYVACVTSDGNCTLFRLLRGGAAQCTVASVESTVDHFVAESEATVRLQTCWDRLLRAALVGDCHWTLHCITLMSSRSR